MKLHNVLLLSTLSLSLNLKSSMAEEAESDDFVPDFFGGRRNEEGNSGMAPPHQIRPKTRAGPSVHSVHVFTFNFTQKLDHFDKCNRRVWNQRYMINDAYFQPRSDGPIFIRIGGEDAISEEDLQDGPIIHLAKEHKALLLSLEHRFYGESKPTLDTKIKNLRYLTSQQALADLEVFIREIRKQYEESNPNAKVVLYGCSYAGSLAAFHRRLYPNSTVGAVAGFAPIVAVANFDDYFESFSLAISKEREGCDDQTQEAIAQIICLAFNVSNICDGMEEVMLQHDAIDFCEPNAINHTRPHTRSSMVYDLLSRLMYIVQYNRKRSDGSSDLKTFCRYMTDPSKGKFALTRYGTWRKEKDGRCVVHHGKSIQTLGTGWNSYYVKAGTRQWLYQMCNEFGYFVAEETSFVIDIKYFMETCEKSFNIVNLEGNVKRTNDFYGGRELMINSTNVYFLSSFVDPWYAAQAHETDTRRPTVIVSSFLQGISHCYEPIGDCAEEQELVDAWNDIDYYVSQWIEKPRDGPGVFTKCGNKAS